MNINESLRAVTSSPQATPELEDPRVIAALEEYLEAIETGNKPNRQTFLARHAEIAGALSGCLDGMEALDVAAAAPHPGPAVGGWQPGAPLGDFRIIREIGRGGMGIVYEAEQISLGRRIALKVLPFAFTLDSRQLQRFKNEARAAAQLHHSNIVPVHAVGCERGVHFYAMQYIEGQTLAEVVQGLRQIAGAGKAAVASGHTAAGEATGPYGKAAQPAVADTAVQPVGALATAYSTDNREFFRTVAKIGVQAAEALEHAHAYGVVHRDVKPGNLLVDVDGHLWVTDFGLAQFRGDVALTRTGDLLGTLRYMSPEQALAKRVPLDHRTDIYSLGATLYELAVLEPAYDGRDREELLRQIAFEEPRPPRRWNANIPADLETIILKAMAKGVEERYATAQELADDLRRFLEHKSILARRPNLLERTAKWSRRHKAVVGTAVVLLLLLAVGLGISTAIIAAAYDQITTEQARTNTALERERKSFQQAQKAVELLIQVSEENLANNPMLTDLRKRLLEAALVYYQTFVDERRDDPSSQAELEVARERVAAILGELYASEGFGRVMFLTHILRERDVQEDLGLDEDQKEKIQNLTGDRFKEFAPSFSTFRQLSPEERRRQFEEKTRAAEKSLTNLLTPFQVTRLKQIARQVRGPEALTDPDVARELGLTPKQQQDLQTIRDEARKRIPGRHGVGGPPPSHGGKGPDPGQAWQETNNRLLNVLTEEQRTRWDQMVGKPFKGSCAGFRGSPGGPKPVFQHRGRAD